MKEMMFVYDIDPAVATKEVKVAIYKEYTLFCM